MVHETSEGTVADGVGVLRPTVATWLGHSEYEFRTSVSSMWFQVPSLHWQRKEFEPFSGK